MNKLNKPTFKDLDGKFEGTKNLVEFCDKNPNSFRFLLVRSFDKNSLKSFLRDYDIQTAGNTFMDLYTTLFSSEVANKELIKFIKERYPQVKSLRKKEEQGLLEALQDFNNVRCGIRNDRLNTLAQEVVRDKTVKSESELDKKIEDKVFYKVRQYVKWSWFNQVTNDLIEHFFNDHAKVLPTLRKIPGLDFFINIGDKYMHFDLKITHISKDYYGMKREESGLLSEIDRIKRVFKDSDDYYIYNRNFTEMVDFIEQAPSNNFRKEGLKAIQGLCSWRAQEVERLKQDLMTLQQWNYENQGERLFRNNNRLFIFLADPDTLEDASYLKRDIPAIKKKVKPFLDNISEDDLTTIQYFYDQGGNRGDYEATSTGILITPDSTAPNRD